MNTNLHQFKKNVFLCHQKEDINFVKLLSQRLKDNRINVWVDYEGLNPGEKWEDKIIAEIGNTDAIIVLISKLANEKEGFFHEEIHFALKRLRRLPPSKKVFIIPILIEQEAIIYEPLKEYQHIKAYDIYDFNWFEKILKSLGIIKEEELEFSIERQNIIITIEKLKLELVECWIEREKYDRNSENWSKKEELASNIVDHIYKNCEKIKETFRPDLLYMQVKFKDQLKYGTALPTLKNLIFIPPFGVLIDRKFIDKKVYIVKKGKKPSSGSASKIIGQYKWNNLICGYALFYSEITQRGYIEYGEEYDIYDELSDTFAVLIGTFKAEKPPKGNID